jgi:flagellar assembly factor FliW
MQSCQTKYFGVLSYEPSAVIEFPEGLPAFEDQRRFILIDRRDLKPLVFMQSLDTPGLCFLTVPAGTVAADYCLELPEEHRMLSASQKPVIGKDVACLAIVTLRPTGPTANLLAPIVIDLRTMRAVQVVMPDSAYSIQHPLSIGSAPPVPGKIASQPEIPEPVC